MRLINTSTFQLREFLDDSIPPYAILSHTWGDDELVYHDIVHTKDVQSEPAFDKIRGCCRIALDFRLEWAWIDTICIDKASSAELSEAINSMFTWYQGAEVCFAYLSDVSWKVGWNKLRLGYAQIDEQQSFLESRWFRRGWTLQELLAPSEVVFLSRDWKRIGTKEGFADLIERITSIRRAFLMFPERLEEASVAERLSWASNRQTSRKEDMAYCLLGLLGINMPLLYGEGDRAFTRLQHEIIRSTYDHTLLAWGLYAPWRVDSRQSICSFLEAPPLLAPSPSAFDRWSSNTRTLSQGAHYVLTNLGLYIDLPIVLYHYEDGTATNNSQERRAASRLGLALLDCYEWTPAGKYRVALPVQLEEREDSGMTPLARRARAASPFLVPNNVSERAERMTMYLQDGKPVRNSKSNAVWFIGCQAMYDAGYHLADYFPPSRVKEMDYEEGKPATLCIVSEPNTEVTLLRLRHEIYNTILVLLEHPNMVGKTSKSLSSINTTSTTPTGQKRNQDIASSSISTGGIGQLWITSTADPKTAFEMALQPSYDYVNFSYILKEFQWTSLGNIASGAIDKPLKSTPDKFIGNRGGMSGRFGQRARSSISKPSLGSAWTAPVSSDEVRVIGAEMLQRIGALQVREPEFFADGDDDAVFSKRNAYMLHSLSINER